MAGVGRVVAAAAALVVPAKTTPPKPSPKVETPTRVVSPTPAALASSLDIGLDTAVGKEDATAAACSGGVSAAAAPVSPDAAFSVEGTESAAGSQLQRAYTFTSPASSQGGVSPKQASHDRSALVRALKLEMGHANRVAWRLQLLRSRVVSLAALQEGTAPPPWLRGAPLHVQEGAVLEALRLAATRHACLQPFLAWWGLCSEAQRRRLFEARSAAEEAGHRMHIRSSRFDEQRGRLIKLERSLRRFGAREKLMAGFGAWRRVAALEALRPAVEERRLCHWLRRLRDATAAKRRSSLLRPRGVAADLRCRAALSVWARHAQQSHKVLTWRLRRSLLGALVRWRAHLRGEWWATRCMAAAVRQSHSRALDAVLFAMWRSNCRRAWVLRARAAERRRLAEAAVWARAARRALRALNAATFEPSEAVAALRALGGEWRGGRTALQLACDELSRQRAAVAEQRATVAQAERTAEAAASRTDSLLAALTQQQQALAAQQQQVERAEAEALCVLRSHSRGVDTVVAAGGPPSLPIAQALMAAEASMAHRMRLAERRSCEMAQRLVRLQHRVQLCRTRLAAKRNNPALSMRAADGWPAQPAPAAAYIPTGQASKAASADFSVFAEAFGGPTFSES